MTWRIGDRGFVMTLSPEVPRLIRTHLRPWLERLARRRAGSDLADVRSWAVHPGGPKILDAVQHALGLDKPALADSREVLAGYGNMSSPTILFILDRLIAPRRPPAVRRARVRPGSGRRGGAGRLSDRPAGQSR